MIFGIAPVMWHLHNPQTYSISKGEIISSLTLGLGVRTCVEKKAYRFVLPITTRINESA